jgi:hypothetical protein
VRILVWHVHGAWTTAFVHGDHDYVVPLAADRGPDGRGRAETYAWPARAREVPLDRLRDEELDVVILQRPADLGLAARWLDRVPGPDVPAVWVEHNAPQGRIAEMVHPAAGREDLTIAHVTHFNDLFWDCGGTPTCVIEHGVVDPGLRYTGELARAGIVVNEAQRRGRVTGTDLFDRICGDVPWDLFGMDSEALGGAGDLPQELMHRELARRRAYVHPNRWTSLGLSLLEAMHLGMPVVALATTEAHDAIPADCGVVTNRQDTLRAGLARLVADPDEARAVGAAARRHALRRYGLGRFLSDWDALLARVARIPAEVQ